jgi:hypothetical protein
MKSLSRLLVSTLSALIFVGVAGPGSQVWAAEIDTDWWMTPQRMIQTNLREIDAGMDLDAYVAALSDYRVNVVLFNVGGIVANYPTELPYHYRNPNMQGDLTAEVVQRLHAAGIRVIGRFDFSKVNEEIARRHPEWLSRDRAGNAYPPYNGQQPTCLNGGYQQTSLFAILSEALDRYPLDGVFFNMIGYPRHDYSGRDLGICHCRGCQDRFREMYGSDLPHQEDAQDPVYRQYQEFCGRTIRDQFERVRQLVKDKNPKAAVCTYTSDGVDVIRSESNTRLGQGTYEDSEKARRILLANPGRQLTNAAVHFIDYPQRHASVSPHLTRRRLLQQMLNGAWLDFYCIGPLHAQEDRLGLDGVRDVFRFHAEHERWLTGTVELADVGLMLDFARVSDEYRGWLDILGQSHLSFDLVSWERSDLARYPALVVPLSGKLNEAAADKLDEYVRGGGRLLFTGGVPLGLKSAGLLDGEVIPRQQGTYIRIREEDKSRLAESLLEKLDLVFLDGELTACRVNEDVEGLLRFIPAAMFGPPEKCYYTHVSDTPALYLRRTGKQGGVAWFPWQIAAHYERQGHAGHRVLAVAALDALLETPRRVRLDASPIIEMNHRAGLSGGFEWISLVNHSGLLGNILHEPLPLRDVKIQLTPQAPIGEVRLLKSGTSIPFTTTPAGVVTCVVPELDDYEMVLFRHK